MLETIAYAAVLLLLAIGSITDFKKREVPDWLSYAAIAFGAGLRLIFAVTSWSWAPLIEGALGFVPLFILALVMYYAGQWGGGDSKVLMGVGILLGAKPTLLVFPLLLTFFINIVMIGSAYGLLYSLVLAALHSREFAREFRRHLSAWKTLKYICYAFAAVFVAASFFIGGLLPKLLLIMLSALSVCLFYIWVFIKSLEKAVMIKKVPVEKLTEGDWIVKDVKIDGRYICGPKDLGIEKGQIAKLIRLKRQGRISDVAVKEGIPFVPGFLLAFIATLALGNWLQLLFMV
jgi:Flp pilus assembly protein protease CpaA